MDGWVKLHRKLLDSAIFDNEKILKVWIWCLMKATYRDYDQLVGNRVISLKAGQFIFGRDVASEELKISPTTVYRYMHVLEKMQMLDLKVDNKFTLVTIENWALYQTDNENLDNKWTTNGQQMDNKWTQTINKKKYKEEERNSAAELFLIDDLYEN